MDGAERVCRSRIPAFALMTGEADNPLIWLDSYRGLARSALQGGSRYISSEGRIKRGRGEARCGLGAYRRRLPLIVLNLDNDDLGSQLGSPSGGAAIHHSR